MAGKGGMNITHAEPFEAFLSRYGTQRDRIEPLLRAFPPPPCASGYTASASKPSLAPPTVSSRRHEGGAAAARLAAPPARERRAFPCTPSLVRWMNRVRYASRSCNLPAQPSPQPSPARGRGSKREKHQIGCSGIGAGGAVGRNSFRRRVGIAAGTTRRRHRSAAPGQLRLRCAMERSLPRAFAGEPLKSVAASFGDARKQGECIITEHGIEAA